MPEAPREIFFPQTVKNMKKSSILKLMYEDSCLDDVTPRHSKQQSGAQRRGAYGLRCCA